MGLSIGSCQDFPLLRVVLPLAQALHDGEQVRKLGGHIQTFVLVTMSSEERFLRRRRLPQALEISNRMLS